MGAGTKAGGPHYLHGLGTWQDEPILRSTLQSPSATSAAGTDGGAAGRLIAAAGRIQGEGPSVEELNWLSAAAALDEAAWQQTFGVAEDISGLIAERNVLRHLPVPTLVRWESGPLVHLLRVIAAGLRADAPLTVSAPTELPEEILGALRAARDVTVVVEDTAAFHGRALQRTRVPASADGGGDPRVRLVLDWDGDPEGSRAAVKALFEAVDGSPDLAVYSGPVVSAGDVELLPYLHEQAIAITAHRFGTPDGLTDHLL